MFRKSVLLLEVEVLVGVGVGRSHGVVLMTTTRLDVVRIHKLDTNRQLKRVIKNLKAVFKCIGTYWYIKEPARYCIPTGYLLSPYRNVMQTAFWLYHIPTNDNVSRIIK